MSGGNEGTNELPDPDGSAGSLERVAESTGDLEEQPEVVFAEVVEELEAAGIDPVRVVSVVAAHRGPLPSASEFAAYEAVLPGAADRILQMAEVEQSHRHSMDGEVVSADMREHERLARGQHLGAGVVLLCCGVAVVALLGGHAGVAAVIMGTTIVSLAAVFVIGRFVGDGGDDDE